MLNKLLNLRNRKKKGFTLIELIVVLVIMAILAAAAIPTVMGYIDNSRRASYLANMRAILQAAETTLTEARDNGKVIENGDAAIDDKTTPTKFIDAVKAKLPNDLKKLTVNAADPTLKDNYNINIQKVNGTDTKVVEVEACYNDNQQIVTLTPGEGSTVMDSGSPTSTPTPTSTPG